MDKRYDYMDIAKGLCMLAVIWGHLMLGGLTNRLCYAFHIQAFFFLSGMLFRPARYDSLKSLWLRRAKTLLLPYALFSLFTWAYWAVRCLVLHIQVKSFFAPLLQTLLAQGSGGFLVHNVALWFVPCLFIVETLYYLFSKLPPWATALSCAFCGALGYWMVQPHAFFDFTRLPWSLDAALTGIVFYGAGQLFVRHFPLNRLQGIFDHRKGALAVITVAAATLLLLLGPRNGHVTMAQGFLGDSLLLFYGNGFVGTAAVLGLSLLSSGLLERFPAAWLLRWVRWLGQNSFTAMAVHIPIMVDVVWLFAQLTGVSGDPLRNSWRFTLPEYLLLLLLTTLWVWLLSRLGRCTPAVRTARSRDAVSRSGLRRFEPPADGAPPHTPQGDKSP